MRAFLRGIGLFVVKEESEILPSNSIKCWFCHEEKNELGDRMAVLWQFAGLAGY